MIRITPTTAPRILGLQKQQERDYSAYNNYNIMIRIITTEVSRIVLLQHINNRVIMIVTTTAGLIRITTATALRTRIIEQQHVFCIHTIIGLQQSKQAD